MTWLYSIISVYDDEDIYSRLALPPLRPRRLIRLESRASTSCEPSHSYNILVYHILPHTCPRTYIIIRMYRRISISLHNIVHFFPVLRIISLDRREYLDRGIVRYSWSLVSRSLQRAVRSPYRIFTVYNNTMI